MIIVVTEKYVYQVKSLESHKLSLISFAFKVIKWKVEFKIGYVL